MADRPRTPHHSPNVTAAQVAGLLQRAHQTHPRWGAHKIKAWLEAQGHRLPAVSTVHSLMRRHGLLPGVPAGAAIR